ncbi:MAG: orotate phosphoribosyltransferase [Proteobacteria bacterium]|jgi:orotate phosphoribosyltransferase|nr:orotate phosphoribosyltransferase [Pseudomonadota bacterium]MBT4356714.1 orotate phosphoribosyltransferase [Pseudomonadota bacterium]MBT5188390.1 orotate phosphoribosyltransferase [Pseudomonadota bacterium]MBT5625857.1 orotate phosphoribosyltransferase [Pseudomonadota bacterium]MBT6067167.1 orotate phosphoribosyltransferase [Pseudomonadota bacterium]
MNTQDHQREHAFLDFALETGVLRFGEFTLKSGRISPYFFNAGLFNSGRSLSRLAAFYASALNHLEPEPFMLFGPAYKGIPLAASTAAALSDHHQRDISFAFNRKEAKDHGEGGQLVGATLQDNVIIIDDVITAGTSIRESVNLIKQAGAQPAAVIIALDREEAITENGESAIQSMATLFDLRVHALARFSTLLEFLKNRPQLIEFLPALEQYQTRYGTGASNRT